MATVIIVENRRPGSPGWVYTWKCPNPDCGEEIQKSEFGQQTFLECYHCNTKIYRVSIAGEEWETK